jgi:hypothetical protein
VNRDNDTSWTHARGSFISWHLFDFILTIPESGGALNFWFNHLYNHTQTHIAMAKGRGSKSSKLQTKREGAALEKATVSDSPVAEKARNVSDALRQAVKDLGGDDEDLDLIAGIDDSENEEEAQPVKKGKKGSDDTVDEVSAPLPKLSPS